MRVFTYHFGYQRIAGIDHRVGADGPWEVKRVLGTVPVEADGSALFRIPAKTPISVQPLDERGWAVALMRSWMTAMPGETLSCVGCHDRRNSSPPSMQTIAARRKPSAVEPWYGPTRGFSFRREVQPVLDKYCVGCHDGQPRDDGQQVPDLRGDQNAYVVFRGGDPRGQIVRDTPKEKLLGKYGGVFEPSYLTLRNLVRVGGLESDLHLLPPMEFHAGTTQLVQMLRKGHHGVQLDAEAWDRLATWIDLNAPCHGTWSEVTPIRRRAAPAADRIAEAVLRRGARCGRDAGGGSARRSSRSCRSGRDPTQTRRNAGRLAVDGGGSSAAASGGRRTRTQRGLGRRGQPAAGADSRRQLRDGRRRRRGG